ncbi:ras-like protein family member 10A [Boleophthalmus pectinirostris]|uniref:ras-like protein family member 10A n=1 Tax=Boleophthalmus pectinirostris TaxID=150288 RepID=UPI00242C28CB|nr:ras-like protein family member 10A [Boleophthalmus pectinirostris]
MVETLSIAVIGAPGVGKTSIIRQFIYHDFCDAYTPTRSRYVYRPAVILNGSMYELKVLDVPPITAFPASSSQEWLDLRCRGVRNANAYILVYDICCVESFEYVKMIRQQIMDNRVLGRSEVPILVVGNKRDLQRQRFMPRRAVSVLVKKTWKCGYVECSAKFNWHVVLLFKELLGIAVARGVRQNHTSIRLQGALQRNRCTIM